MASPFSRLLNPDQAGTFTGFLGRVTGQQSMLDYRANALAKLSEIQQNDPNPGSALMKLFGSPEFHDAFARDPDFTSTITDLIKTAQVGRAQMKPTDMEANLAGAGIAAGSPEAQQAYKIKLGLAPEAGQPTEFQKLADIAGLKGDDLRKAALVKLTKPGDPTQQQQAVQALYDAGIIDDITGQKILAGVLRPIENKDQFGQPTGTFTIVDLTDPNNPGAIPLRPNQPGNKVQAPTQDLPDGSQAVTPQPSEASDSGQPATETGKFALTLDRTPPALRGYFANASAATGVPADLLASQAYFESRFRNVTSPAGAKGISQFMPATAKRFGVNVNDPQSSINGQAKYMQFLLNRYNGNVAYALAGYNWGEGNVDKWIKNGADPRRLPAETRTYIARITGTRGIDASNMQVQLDGSNTGASADAQGQESNPQFTPAGQRMKDPSEMFLGVGPVGVGAEIGGGILGNIDPALRAGRFGTYRNAMRQLQFSVSAMRNSGRLAADAKKAEALVPDMGVTSNPADATQSAIQLYDFIIGLKAKAVADQADISNSIDVRKEANKDVGVLNKILLSLPTREQMTNRLQNLDQGRGGQLGVGDVISGVEKAVSGAVGDVSGAVEGAVGGQPQGNGLDVAKLGRDEVLQLAQDPKSLQDLSDDQLKELSAKWNELYNSAGN